MMMDHELYANEICTQALKVFDIPALKFSAMRRLSRVKAGRGFVIGRTNLKTGSITIDIYTAKKRQPKKIASILRVLCHEVAHHQKKPFRQRWKGHIITRSHYPVFYRQVKRNIMKLRKAGVWA